MNTLTQADIEKKIMSEAFFKVGQKTTVCLLTLENGFEIVGTSACVDPTTFDLDLGKKYAKERALNKVWELEGYMAQTLIHHFKENNNAHNL